MGRHASSPRTCSCARLNERWTESLAVTGKKIGCRRGRRGWSHSGLAFPVEVEDVGEEDELGDPLGQGSGDKIRRRACRRGCRALYCTRDRMGATAMVAKLTWRWWMGEGNPRRGVDAEGSFIGGWRHQGGARVLWVAVPMAMTGGGRKGVRG